jgi:hypothetical protein
MNELHCSGVARCSTFGQSGSQGNPVKVGPMLPIPASFTALLTMQDNPPIPLFLPLLVASVQVDNRTTKFKARTMPLVGH